MREIVALYLERLGYNVLEAKNGLIAVELIEKMQAGELDLIVTDMLMPKAGGEAVIEAACQRHTCERFLIMSGFSQEMSRQADHFSPNSRFLEKPFTFDAFEAKIGELTRVAI